MHDEDTRALVDLYEGRYIADGAEITTLGWKNREEQRLRFDVLSGIGPLQHATVCDVGCGFGDLADYFREKQLNVTYTGLDIAPSFVAHAKATHPEDSFIQLDLDQDPYDQEHDYFLSSGALSFKRQDNMAHATRMIEKMFSLCRKGVAVNFLSTYVNHQHPRNFHYSPEDVFRLARGLTKWVKIRHDYPLWEFTLYLYKEAQA
ncbi:class I SAM-dependent methyltransferase [Achromobacter sp.]|uniref:class I SAM-dependent methyltransferase n=1 Tax=Achromobacter sp. TaxID=134375 RepID=UPI0028997184|nr:class I SAM-dependent methyltransferase [Achromobacter sp.]